MCTHLIIAGSSCTQVPVAPGTTHQKPDEGCLDFCENDFSGLLKEG